VQQTLDLSISIKHIVSKALPQQWSLF
jgi:hypothetical protein